MPEQQRTKKPKLRAVTLIEALSLTDEAKVVSSATAPYPIIHTNKAWSELTKYKFTDVVGKPCKFLQGPATAGAALEALNLAIREQREVTTQVINYTKYGQPFYNTITCLPVVGGSHFFATITSISITDPSVALPLPMTEAMIKELAREREVMHEDYSSRARRSKRCVDHVRLNDVINNQEDPIVICAKEYPHVITHPNKAWLEMCGYELEEVEGLTNKILTGPETDPEKIEDLLACVRRCEPSIQTMVNYKKGGVRFVNQVHTLPVYDENDELQAFMSFLKEVGDEELLD